MIYIMHIMIHYRFYEPMNNRPSQCFLFKTCGRKVENATFDCVLNKENTLEVEAFVDSETTCESICQKVSHFLQEVFHYSSNVSILVTESAMWLL